VFLRYKAEFIYFSKALLTYFIAHADAVITLENLTSWLLGQITNGSKRFKNKHFATLVDTIVPCKYKFGAGKATKKIL